jgi:hypothetical protein
MVSRSSAAALSTLTGEGDSSLRLLVLLHSLQTADHSALSEIQRNLHMYTAVGQDKALHEI